MNGGIINSITRLHLVGYFYRVILRCTDPWILNSSKNHILSSLKENTKATKTCQLKRVFGNPLCSRACHAGWPTAPSDICIVGIPAWPKYNTRHVMFGYSGNLRGTSKGPILLTTNWMGLRARLPTLCFGVLLYEYRCSSNLRNVNTRLSNHTQNIPGDINF